MKLPEAWKSRALLDGIILQWRHHLSIGDPLGKAYRVLACGQCLKSSGDILLGLLPAVSEDVLIG